ncbi:MAG TPA: hypothetical protein VMY59_04245 [Candidatus Thermoplasmatota archaeon]|nr:hypothetical protein [Candidatus Thermoplasmatota archaeon]
MSDSQSTLKQRIALENMHRALGWSMAGVRDMTKAEASAAIDKAKKHIDEHGFPDRGRRDGRSE